MAILEDQTSLMSESSVCHIAHTQKLEYVQTHAFRFLLFLAYVEPSKSRVRAQVLL